MYQWGVPLTLLTLSDIVDDISLHLRPPKTLGYCLVGQQVSPDITATYSLMELDQERINLTRMQT